MLSDRGVESSQVRRGPSGWSTGPAVPPYLLERGERTCSTQRDAPSYVDVAALRARWVPMPEIADADEVGDGWMRESLADAARREREYVAWEAAHGAERDEQLASIANADFYWALPHEIGRRPRWQLREAKHRAQDGICTVGRNELDVEEPFPRYRSFLPFTGNVLRAQEFFAASVWERDEAWLDDERLKLRPIEAMRPSQPPCMKCGNCKCSCVVEPESDEDGRTGGYSVDCGYGGTETWERGHQTKELAGPQHPLDRDPDTLTDLVLADDERRALFYQKPPGELPANVSAPPLFEPEDFLEVLRVEREARLACADDRPPHRQDERYGPVKDNAAGDEAFRADRAAWYERATGDSLDGRSLAEQRRLCDAIARRFRAYSDGRAPCGL